MKYQPRVHGTPYPGRFPYLHAPEWFPEMEGAERLRRRMTEGRRGQLQEHAGANPQPSTARRLAAFFEELLHPKKRR